eukprot:jgi/Phyca11/508385/fgenesh2_kg.PHYCAscaffold_34_\
MAQWNAVQPGLELALSSTPLVEFPTIDSPNKTFLDDVLNLHVPRLDRCVRDRTGDDHAYLRFKHHKIKTTTSNKPAVQEPSTTESK